MTSLGPQIRCSCPVCGSLTLPATAFLLVVCASDPDRSFYQFTCPRCEHLITRQANVAVVTGLSSRRVTTSAFPAEALEDHAGPPLTLDDLLDFALDLQKLETSP